MRVILLLLLTVCTSCSSDHQLETVESFTMRLNTVAMDEDVIALKSMLHDTVFESNDICGYPGCDRETFLEFHFTSDPRDEDWSLLRESLSYGMEHIRKDSALVIFSNASELYEAPTYWRNVDHSKELLILKNETTILSQPDLSSRPIKAVDSGRFSCACCIYDNDGFVEDQKGNIWIRIQLKDEGMGYVHIDNTSLRNMKIVEIARIKGQWKIITFYSGEPC